MAVADLETFMGILAIRFDNDSRRERQAPVMSMTRSLADLSSHVLGDNLKS